eukprot:788738-Rhodomonas_salina.1
MAECGWYNGAGEQRQRPLGCHEGGACQWGPRRSQEAGPERVWLVGASGTASEGKAGAVLLARTSLP